MYPIRLCSVIFALIQSVPILTVELEDNGYTLHVAIHRDVKENETIIDELKKMLTSASEYLYLATRGYFYISQVTIIVPETWPSNASWNKTDFTFKEADIRVDSPHRAMGNNPYTFQPGQCGDAGRYIHLTPDYILSEGFDREATFGDSGRLLVHEFAHLRFGVFDEYGSSMDSNHKEYYTDDDGILQPTACSKQIKGSFIRKDIKNFSCETGNVSYPLKEGCRFEIDNSSNAVSSVMFAQFLEQVTDFCESNPKNETLKHNADAPNKQNKMCNDRGTWDIIKENSDMIGIEQGIIANTTPTFKIMQHHVETINDTRICGRRFVFVLDLSGSMTTKDRYFKLRQMTDKVIKDILPFGTEVGIVVFNETARVWSEMTHLMSQSDKETLAAGLPLNSDFGGATAIGNGLLKGIEMLQKGNKSAERSRIFLVTDGQENEGPTIASVTSNSTFIKAGVVVHTLAYSSSAAKDLSTLSALKGGQYSFYDETSASTALDPGGRLVRDISLCEDDTVEIDRAAIHLNASETSYDGTFLVDSTVGNNTLFIFTLPKNSNTTVTVTGPDQTTYNNDSMFYNIDKNLNIIRFLFPTAKAGYWNYTIAKESGETEIIVGVLKSHPRSADQKPFEAEAWTSSNFLNFSSTGLAIYTYVHQGYSPIIGAEVTVTMTDAHGNVTNKPLHDHGMLPDNTADDGVYTNYLPVFKKGQRLSLLVRVESVEGKTFILRFGDLLSGRALPLIRNHSVPAVYEPVEAFIRTASPGAIDVEEFDETLDPFEPSRITDLEVEISDRFNDLVTLTWTAPGDDLNEGTVEQYDLRIAETFDELRQKFTNSYKVRQADIRSGSINPLPAGSQQKLVIKLPSQLNTVALVFGLKAIDDANRTSSLSNLQAIAFEIIYPPAASTTGTTTPPRSQSLVITSTTEVDDSTTKPTSPHNMTADTIENGGRVIGYAGLVISACVAVCPVALIIITAICIVKSRRKDQKPKLDV